MVPRMEARPPAADDVGQHFPAAGIHAGEADRLPVGAQADHIAAGLGLVEDDGADDGDDDQDDEAHGDVDAAAADIHLHVGEVAVPAARLRPVRPGYVLGFGKDGADALGDLHERQGSDE